ncbi:nitrogenase molybdenum-iron protein alpha chain [Halanaerobium saccharolyticum]|uniref:Nitrogenase protein alpha chain n=1 Tax=Halanaerobium saccharolyticum TaxID=43595 RepID=A0A2T5RJR2_9FIRM|nr:MULTISPECIES: nitrogenase molybdenum-iron protein alpha chain [Halanaerobium]KXS48848.1 MAG: nitrogenase molybdenum-iron protein alpha chain [Halanaerobium sp. T82-1]PTV98913.1 Mo-nitrogenase MoFe protein subunit NifD precursor [Halanaerobium saccharolyticum]PUU94392.1 MAG: nitrogenase molybdenum-iron protein alpha chain [Halanaerobium sp.]TDP89031.1 Mo-nitrogenase MoFe protein subunit NifD precursor [Halanaerobium saccharolyticum]
MKNNNAGIEDVLDEVLQSYPAKSMKNRKEHILVKEKKKGKHKIKANTRTIPGIITNRGCAYAGCRGVVLGPLKDVVQLVHGPIGCSYYAWGMRRHQGMAAEGGKNFINYTFSTDMQDSDVVFGGERKLKEAIKEAVEIFNPSTIMITATCPVGLIGDDINSIARQAEEEYGIKVMAFNCEGYKGVSQSAGHHIANNNIMSDLVGIEDKELEHKYPINLMGEYNIGGDAFEIERILDKIGYDIVASFSGNGTADQIKYSHEADLNLVQCHRSINYIAEMFEEKYGIPWLKVNFLGVDATIKSLRNMAEYFDDPELKERTEKVIAEELAQIDGPLNRYKELFEGKTAFLFVGGSRAHHYQNVFKRIGIETVVAGYEFGHRDDYEGREVIPDIEMTADDRNIPELEVTKDDKKYKMRISETKKKELQQKMPLDYYEGMIKEMEDGSIVIDDLNHHEHIKLTEALEPDIFCSGIKDKYTSHKMGIFSKQLHSYDYSGPYAGFKGHLQFAEDIAAGILNPSWSYINPPWKDNVELKGTIGGVK